MAPLSENETLGTKYKNYNTLVNDVIANKTDIGVEELDLEKRDLDNLIKIDVASHNKDINYILGVLKSKDMLYVSRAIQKCPWLVDDEHAHIINPQYLADNLFPQMTSKAITKFTTHIRHYLTNEGRVEEFYNSQKDLKEAGKWLSRCSIPFIVENIDDHKQKLQPLEFKRLCEKSVTIFETIFKNNFGRYNLLKSATFLLRTHVNIYLDVVENLPRYFNLELNSNATDLIMKQCPERVTNKLHIYLFHIHIPTYVKYLKSNEIKDFLYKQANKKDTIHNYHRSLFKYNIIQHFIRRMPETEQFDFVKQLFIDKTIEEIDEKILEKGTEIYAAKMINKYVCERTPAYYWYTFAPFEVAFDEIKKLIHVESAISKKYEMLNVLISAAGKNMKNIQTLLIYFNKQHIKDDNTYQSIFIDKLLTTTFINKYDEETWQKLNSILDIMNVYKEPSDVTSECSIGVKTVLLYNLIHDKPVPDVITKKIDCFTLVEYKNKLNKKERENVFNFLYKHALNKINELSVTDEETFKTAIQFLADNLMQLLMDWEKSILDYPVILEKTKYLIRVKNENSWKADLSCLYNKNKLWRKYMFEESLALYPTEKTCFNALKHDPALLDRYKEEVQKLCTNDKISMNQVLRKLKIYWPDSLAEDWTKSYLTRLSTLGGHKALIRGICTLLTQNSLLEIIKQYAPHEAKINWDNVDELSLSLMRAIAKNMHIARPQPIPDAVLLYAKGDYLQYALPSVLAIFYNLSQLDSQEYIPKILDAPVSLQKHGLRFAFVKLEHKILKQILLDIWNQSKNVTIRALIFDHFFKVLCKEKDDAKALELWEILEVFMENFTFKEDKKILDILAKVSNLPLKVRAPFLVKSYNYLKSYYDDTKDDQCPYKLHKLATYTMQIMEFMCPEFVENLIKEFANKKLFNRDGQNHSSIDDDDGMVKVLSVYVLCEKDEEKQLKRYERTFDPIIKNMLDMWNETFEGEYFIRRRLQALLTRHSKDLEYVVENKLAIPTQVFQKISLRLQSLIVSENYTLLTMWKLSNEMAKIIKLHGEYDEWEPLCRKIVPQLGNTFLECLKQDVELYFPCIYILFCRALTVTLGSLENTFLLYEVLLSDAKFVQAYLAVNQLIPKYFSDDECSIYANIKKRIREHASVEVKMHYLNKFNDLNLIY